MIPSIFLVGFMGSGKTEVGQLLAEKLGWTFLDLDEVIVQQAGCSIPELFEREGEAGFRKWERSALQCVLPHTDTVVSCGGGIVTVPENQTLLLDHPGTFCLQVSAEEVWRRVGQDPNRPLLQGDHPREGLESLLKERQPLYDQYPRQVATQNLRPTEVADRILSVVRK